MCPPVKNVFSRLVNDTAVLLSIRLRSGHAVAQPPHHTSTAQHLSPCLKNRSRYLVRHFQSSMSQQPLLSDPCPTPPRSPRADAAPVPKHRRCEGSEDERAPAGASEAEGCISNAVHGGECDGVEGRWLHPRPVFDRSLILAPMVSSMPHHAFCST